MYKPKGVTIILKGLLFMLLKPKIKTTAYLNPVVSKYLKVFAATNSKTISEVTEASLLFSLENPAFLESLKEVKP